MSVQSYPRHLKRGQHHKQDRAVNARSMRVFHAQQQSPRPPSGKPVFEGSNQIPQDRDQEGHAVVISAAIWHALAQHLSPRRIPQDQRPQNAGMKSPNDNRLFSIISASVIVIHVTQNANSDQPWAKA